MLISNLIPPIYNFGFETIKNVMVQGLNFVSNVFKDLGISNLLD